MKRTRQRCQVAFNTRAMAAFSPFVRVGDHRFDTAQTAAGERAKEFGPERFGLRAANRYAQGPHAARRRAIRRRSRMVTATETMRPPWRTFT